MRVIVATSVGKLDNGQELILFPSRWDSAVNGRRPFAYYPYELAYLSSLLKRETDHSVRMIDGNLALWDADQYAAHLIALNPDVLVTECSALTYPAMTRCARLVEAATGCSLWLTGPLGTHDARRALLDGWDCVFGGEYEAKVLHALQGTEPPAGYIDLDWLPWPEDTDIARIDYFEISNPVAGLIQVYPTRGCPLACTFCVVPTYYGGHGKSHRSHRQRDPNLVCDELEHLAAKYGDRFGGAFFNEEAHNANPEWLARFAQALIDRGLNRYVYDAMCGVWTLTPEIVDLMARAGYKQIRFGVESTSELVGREIRKTLHLDRIESAMRWLRDAGIAAYVTLQVGAPGSTEAIDRATLADLARWRSERMVTRYQVSTSTPLPGTPFHKQATEMGWLITNDLSRYDGERAVVSYPNYTADRIEAVRRSA